MIFGLKCMLSLHITCLILNFFKLFTDTIVSWVNKYTNLQMAYSHNIVFLLFFLLIDSCIYYILMHFLISRFKVLLWGKTIKWISSKSKWWRQKKRFKILLNCNIHMTNRKKSCFNKNQPLEYALKFQSLGSLQFMFMFFFLKSPKLHLFGQIYNKKTVIFWNSITN